MVQHIRWFMQRRGLNHQDPAAKIGTWQGHLGRILKGIDHIYLTHLARIANALNKDVRITYPEREQLATDVQRLVHPG